jgi:hypothetical protein
MTRAHQARSSAPSWWIMIGKRIKNDQGTSCQGPNVYITQRRKPTTRPEHHSSQGINDVQDDQLVLKDCFDSVQVLSLV